MKKVVFSSYKYEDKIWRDKVVDWARNGRLGQVNITGETLDMRSQGQSAIRGHLRPLINEASCLMLFVGNDTHNANGVAYEIHHARSHGIAIVAVRIPNTRGGLPTEARGVEVVDFEPAELRRALQRI